MKKKRKTRLSDLIRYYLDHGDLHYALVLILAAKDGVSLTQIYKIIDLVKKIANINITRSGIRSWLHEQVHKRKILTTTIRGIYKINIEHVEVDLDKVKKILKKYSININEIRKILQQDVKQITTLLQQITNIQIINNEEFQKLLELYKKYGKQLLEIENILQILEELKNKNNNLQEELNKLNEEKKKLVNELERLKQEVNKLRNELKQKEQEMNKLEAKLREWVDYSVCHEFEIGLIRKRTIKVCTSNKIIKIIQVAKQYMMDSEFEEYLQKLSKLKYIKII